MRSVLRKIFQFLNRDISGKSWEKEVRHPYFGRMIYFGHSDPGRSYWEAELSDPTLAKRIGVTLEGTITGPEPHEEAFCREIMMDLDNLFAKCENVFRKEYSKWTHDNFPDRWRDKFVLDGFSVPRHGDANGEWEVCYEAQGTGHYFTAQFQQGRVTGVIVDG